jgi:2-aminoethylphosphonate-pyruvate transaminase
MSELGFKALLPRELQSPIITSFLYPSADFNFNDFYKEMKKRGFVLYPGKISQADTFRIGNIGEVYPEDIRRLLREVALTKRLR